MRRIGLRRMAVGGVVVLGLIAPPGASACNNPTVSLSPDHASPGAEIYYQIINMDPGDQYTVQVDGQTIVPETTAEGPTVDGHFTLPDNGGQPVDVEGLVKNSRDDWQEVPTNEGHVYPPESPPPAPQSSPPPQQTPAQQPVSQTSGTHGTAPTTSGGGGGVGGGPSAPGHRGPGSGPRAPRPSGGTQPGGASASKVATRDQFRHAAARAGSGERRPGSAAASVIPAPPTFAHPRTRVERAAPAHVRLPANAAGAPRLLAAPGRRSHDRSGRGVSDALIAALAALALLGIGGAGVRFLRVRRPQPRPEPEVAVVPEAQRGDPVEAELQELLAKEGTREASPDRDRPLTPV